MKKTKRALVIIAGLIIVIIIAGIIYQRQLSRKALPDYGADISLKQLNEKVEIYRDSLGIPHIYAKNQEDLYRATGYAMAQERMWQMDLLRRVTLGRLSEIFGSDFLQADRLFRALQFSEKSRRLRDSIPPRIMANLRAFTAGINQYMADQQGDLPPEFTLLGYEPDQWEVFHTINLIGYMAWDLSGSWHSEAILYKLKNTLKESKYKNLIPDMKLLEPAVYKGIEDAEEQLAAGSLLDASGKVSNLGLEVFTGSNNWAVSGAKSANGNAILANDMHLGLNIPGIWMQMHQVIPGEVNVTGVALPGAPFIICGHNSDIAWGMTNVMLDDIDFYRETINPADSNQYRFNGEWRDMKVQKEVIRTDAGEEVERTIRFTHRGPIISGFKDMEEPVSMRWVGNTYSNELLGVYRLNYGHNWDDFKHAVKNFRAISQNIAYADKQGNIGMYTCAGVPKRKSAGYQVFPGDTSLYDWNGFVPFDSLPHVYNPERGFVFSSNSKIVDEDYPYYISYWYDLPYRAKRIRGFLESKEKFSVQDFKRLQTDHYSKLAELMMPKLAEVLTAANLNSLESKGMKILSTWNYYADAAEAAPLIFEETFNKLVYNVFADEMNDKLYEEFLGFDLLPTYLLDKLLHGRTSDWTDDVDTPDEKENFRDMLLQSYKDAIASLDEKLGSDPEAWKWGDLHTITLEHPLGEVASLERIFKLNRGPYGVGGSFNTVSPNSFSFNNPYKTNHGASQRHVYPAADWDKAETVIPTGTSGIPASPHYCDQTKMYINLEYHRDLFSKKTVEQFHQYHMQFLPR